MEKRSRLQLVEAIVIVGFTSSVLFHAIMFYYLGFKFYPYGTFLYHPSDRFNDFYNIIQASKDLNPYTNPISVYFPFTFILTYLFAFLTPAWAFAVFTGSFVLFFTFYVFKYICHAGKREAVMGVLIFSAMSYPFLFSLDRSNLENLVFIVLAASIHYFVKEKYYTSGILLSVPVAMKLYPIVFLPLFFIKRQYKAGLLAVLSSCFLTIISAALLKGGIIQSSKGLLSCLSLFYAQCVTGSLCGLQHNLSLLGFLKIILLCIKSPSALFYLDKGYFIAACLLYCMLVCALCLHEISAWKRISLLVFSMLLLPQVSFDYKLMHLFIPLMLYINTEERSPYDVAYAWLFGLLLIPKDYYWLCDDISIAVLINPMLMIAMGLLIMVECKIMGKMSREVP